MKYSKTVFLLVVTAIATIMIANCSSGELTKTSVVPVLDTGEITVPGTGDVTVPGTGDVTVPGTGEAITEPNPNDMGQPADETTSICNWKMESCPPSHKELMFPLIPKIAEMVAVASPESFMTLPASAAFMISQEDLPT